MPSLFALLRKVLADRRAEPRVGSEYAVELIVGITAGGERTTLFSHTLDVSRGGLAVFIPRVEANSFMTGGDSPLSITLALPRGTVRMLAAPRHVRSLKGVPRLGRGYAVGFRIGEMAEDDRLAYHSFVSGLAGERGGR